MSAYILIFVVAAVAANDVLSFSFLFVCCCLFVCMLFFLLFFVFIYLFCSFIKLVLFRFLARFSISRTYLNLHKCNSLLYILGSTNISYIF